LLTNLPWSGGEFSRYLTVALFLLVGVAPAAASTWTLFARHYIWGGRSFSNPQIVYISPSERPCLFWGVAAICVTALCLSVFLTIVIALA